jgi:predicted glycosyltransferase involved in capsule biosynthesis
MKLTIVASNRDRLDLNSNITKWFIKSLEWQDRKDFEVIIVDSNSQNYKELKTYFEGTVFKVPIHIISHSIDLFSRSVLNNAGIRNASTEYIASTDVDMVYARDFISDVITRLKPDKMIESRTMYWKQGVVDLIYSGKLDPYNNINNCRLSRTKKRASAGGFQCMHIDSWRKIRGFDERYKIWGSEDQDLLIRAQMAGLKVEWMGENNDIKLFHQPHPKKNIKNDLEWQEKNKKILSSVVDYRANLNGWGGYVDSVL